MNNVEKIRQKLAEKDLDAVIIENEKNQRYAAGFPFTDGSVHVIADADEETVSLTVEDTGIGIPEEDRLNIFSRFYRVDKARSREAGGSGLGLSIVHDAVLKNGGTVVAANRREGGMRFQVSFPAAEQGKE